MSVLCVTIAEDLTGAHVNLDTLEMAKNALVIIQLPDILINWKKDICVGSSFAYMTRKIDPKVYEYFLRESLIYVIQTVVLLMIIFSYTFYLWLHY